MDSPYASKARFVRDYSSEDGYDVYAHQTLRSPSSRDHRDDWTSSPRPNPIHAVVPFESWDTPSSRNLNHSDSRYEEDVRKVDLKPESLAENSAYEASISTQPTSSSVNQSSRIADFFGPEVYQIVLHNPTTAHQLKKFAESRLCGENLEFLEQIDYYQRCLNEVTKTVFDIHKNYISSNAPSQVNLPEDVMVQINKNLKQLLAKTMPNMESVFLTAQNDVQKLVQSDIYPRFVRHQITLSATKALATNRKKYTGLGDCFVLTNPNKADNPIVYASDGFVKVTGYARNEIVPRNCRFLQTKQTDRGSVGRIKKSLTTPSECVELLLNERKNGEPFWNLLYTAPLYDAKGHLAFFLGGQIDVSTAVHSTSDVLRILSFKADDDEDQPDVRPPDKPSKQSFFGTLKRSKPVPVRTPGMENDLVEDLEKMSIRQQKEAFYSAYSKYFVVNAETMMVSFHSAGIKELLFSARYTPTIPIVGQDIFTFLARHATSGLPRDYKSRVRSGVKNGAAVSVDLALSTRRTAGSEMFATHWTPLKNDTNQVAFLVLTLGSLQDARR